MFEKLKKWAQHLKHNLYALYLASHHKEMPLISKMVAILVVSYALSPIDLIPDFIPVVGYLDDLILLPLGIILVIKLTPTGVWSECKMNAQKLTFKSLPNSKTAAFTVITIWIILFILLYSLVN